MLRREQLKDGYVELKRAKSGARKVLLTADALATLNGLEDREERLFTYTLDGFASNWKRVKKKAGLAGFRFHDLRREFISRLLESMANPSSVAVAQMAGMADPKYIEKAFVEPGAVRAMIKHGIRSQSDLMRTVGHSSPKTTLIYTALRKK